MNEDYNHDSKNARGKLNNIYFRRNDNFYPYHPYVLVRFETVISTVLVLPITNRSQLTDNEVNNMTSESLLGAFSMHFTLWQHTIWYIVLNKWKFGSSQKATTSDDKLLWEDSRLAVVEVGWSDGIVVAFTRLVVKDGTVADLLWEGLIWLIQSRWRR